MVNFLKKLVFSVFVVYFFLSTPVYSEPIQLPEARYPLNTNEVRISLSKIQTLIDSGEWIQAKEQYQALLQYDLSYEEFDSVQIALEDLNLKILFSPILTSDSFQYRVKPGDSLYKIAKMHETTVGLLKKSNHLDGDVIYPGMKLKVSQSVYSIFVDKSENKLKLIGNGELIKTYSVATGLGDKTPIGTYTIENKLVDPAWYTVGAVFPADSPENILGTRWLGFSLAGYGIHGTTEPQSIGTHATRGCVRMYNHDVEELYSIVPIHTKVTIVE
jgi:lipoprotein-anchoring transpeptidase ErfK/SrfK